MSSKDDIQDIKKRKESLKERMLRRKQERQNLGIGDTTLGLTSMSSATNAKLAVSQSESLKSSTKNTTQSDRKEDSKSSLDKALSSIPTPATDILKQLNNTDLTNKENTQKGSSEEKKSKEVENLESNSLKRKRESSPEIKPEEPPPKQQETAKDVEPEEVSIESLLSSSTFKEQESKEMGQEIFELLCVPTAKEQSLAEKFKSQEGTVHEFCPHGTREECRKLNETCDKLHFKRIIKEHTDESLGDCSFLNTCFHMDTCKYVHYQVESPQPTEEKQAPVPSKKAERSDSKVTMLPPQWIQCDIRYLDMTVLGKYAVIMADPPWDIHMELPYGTMQDDEMRKMRIPDIQDDGFIFLWVTGRAMELGRECLKLWGYSQVEELIWVKTNQLQRLIRTGRTGHWLNHGKEHCLVGVKGNPQGYNKGLDCDVIVAEVRQTSHKPDEIYGLIERLSPGTRKIEFFGRMHNVQPNWVTLGNQLDGVHLVEPELINKFKEKYPDMNALKPPAK